MSLGPGDEFAGYRIEAVLGTGGMGAVYLARHPRLPRRDALKLLNPAFSADPAFRSRFEREADLAAGLIHRNIVAVYDRGSVDGQLWISMQYVGGTDAAVASKVGDGSMPPQRVVHIVSEVGAGLDYAHRAGLLHRDVKPANILLAPPDDPDDPEHVLLTDFGIAKSADEVQHLTGTGNLLATLAYASPEQIEAQPLDHRVDIYALGCVMYELLTGSVPFAGNTPFATMNAHLKEPPPRPSEKVRGLPRGLDDVVARAMAKDRDQRYGTCRELSIAARAALGTAPAASVLPPMPSPGIPDAGPGQGGPAAAGPVPVVALTAPRPPFRVTLLRRSTPGGAAELGPIATDRLPAQQRIRVEELLHGARFFDLPERLPLEYVVPGDVFLEVTVAAERASRTVGYERQGARHPAELDEIVALLEHLAPWRPLGGGQWQPSAPSAVPVPPALGPMTGDAPHPVRPPHTVAMSPAAAAAFTGAPPAPGPQTGPTGYHQQGGPPTGHLPPGAQGFAGPPGPPSGPVAAPPAQPPANRARTWLIVAIVAVVAVIASAVTIYLLTRSNADPVATGPTGSTSAPATTSGGTAETTPTTESAGTTESSPETTAPESTTPEPTTAESTGESPPTVADSWGDLGYMLADFPDLLPATPAATGYDGASCSVTDDTEQSGVDALVSCIDPAGRYWEVMHFPDTQTRDAYLQRDWSGAVQEPWNVDEVVQGRLYRSADDEATLPYVITTFDSPQRELYLLYAHWSEHTTTQLIDEWWKPAAF